MPTKRANYPVEVKTLGDTGRVEALVSVFNNVDLVGDRVMPGAFAKSIAAWKQSGDPVPVVFSHEWDDVWSHIGVVESLAETPKGLKAVYALDINDNPVAAQVYKLLKRRSLKEHSFAYDVQGERRAKDGANDLTQLGIIEIGPTLKGANPDTELLTVKSLLDAAKQHDAHESSLSGRKVWVDAELPGSFDEIRDSISDAVSPVFNPSADQNIYVSVQAVYPDYALVEVCQEGTDDQTYKVPYTIDGDTATLGTPEAVEVTVSVQPKSAAKAGRRLSQATETEMKAIRDDAYAVVGRMDALMGVAEDSSGGPKGAKHATADPNENEENTEPTETEGPEAKSADETVVDLRTRILAMRATTGVTP